MLKLGSAGRWPDHQSAVENGNFAGFTCDNACRCDAPQNRVDVRGLEMWAEVEKIATRPGWRLIDSP
jgi:hypothetical protein